MKLHQETIHIKKYLNQYSRIIIGTFYSSKAKDYLPPSFPAPKDAGVLRRRVDPGGLDLKDVDFKFEEVAAVGFAVPFCKVPFLYPLEAIASSSLMSPSVFPSFLFLCSLLLLLQYSDFRHSITRKKETVGLLDLRVLDSLSNLKVSYGKRCIWWQRHGTHVAWVKLARDKDSHESVGPPSWRNLKVKHSSNPKFQSTLF